jgi:hypothetical protein
MELGIVPDCNEFTTYLGPKSSGAQEGRERGVSAKVACNAVWSIPSDPINPRDTTDAGLAQSR